MILLEKDKYGMVSESLREVVFNHAFARSVAEKHVHGTVYVDDIKLPETFYVVHPYKMSLLFGNPENDSFNTAFRKYALNTSRIRDHHEWMQAFPDDWHVKLKEIFPGKMVRSEDNLHDRFHDRIEINTRVNFRFDRKKYSLFRHNNPEGNFRIIRTDKDIFGQMKGTVVPMYFWEDAGQFVKNSVGFSLFYGDELASTAYAAFIHDGELELGIETVEKFRGRGLAQHTCVALIDYCLKNDFEPVWSCRLENKPSFNLARKLGFEPIGFHPYYRLVK